MSKDFDNNIPNFATRKKVLKLILFLLVVSLAILVVQLFFKESLSFTQGNLAIINSFIAFILLFIYIMLTADMYVTIKIIKEREKGKFISVEDLKRRTKMSQPVVDKLKNIGAFSSLSETNQISLF